MSRSVASEACSDQGVIRCGYNNIVLAAKRALEEGLERVLIVDFDVHHGNGTQEAFYEDDRVLFISIHRF